jgi:hypothetical protein
MGVRSGPKIPTRGSEFEIITNGTFAGNSETGWTSNDDTTTTVTNNQLVITSAYADYGVVFWPISLTEGVVYRFSYQVVAATSHSYHRVGTTATDNQSPNTSIFGNPSGVSAGDTLEVIFTATSTQAGHSYLSIGARNDITSLTIDNVSLTPVNSPLVLCLDAMNAKSFAGEPTVNYMQWQNGYPQGWTANSENNTTNGFTRMWLYNSGSGSGYSRHCRRIRKVDGRENVLHLVLRNKTSADTRWFFPLIGIPKAEKTSAFLLTYDYKVMSNNSYGTNPQWYATSYGTSTQGGYFSDVELPDAGVGGLTDYSSSSEQAFPSAVRQVIPTSGTGVVDLGGGWYRRTIAIPANTFVESGSDGSGTGGTGVYGRFGIYTAWGSLGDYSFLMHNIQLLKGNTVGAPVALGGLGPELITNGNMETTTGTGTSGITNWTFGGSPAAGSGRSSVTSHEGTYSLALVLDASGTDSNFQQASVFPAGSTGKTFEITFWARVDSGSSSTSGPTVALYLDGSTSAYSQYLTTSWKKCLFKFTKSSHSQSSFVIKRGGGTAGRTIYIDQVSVKEITCARNATDGWKDISGNGNHATFSSTSFGDSGNSDFRRHGEILLPASTNITSAPASINFDGSNDYTDLGQATDGTGGLSLKGYASLSICQWVNLDSVSSYYRTFYENQTDANNNYRVTFLGDSSSFAFYIYTSSGTAGAGKGSAIATGAWTHIAGTYDGANIRLYINGEQTGSTSLTGAVESSTGSYGGIAIGARKSGSSLDQYVNGKIATTSVWSSALTHAHVKQIYNSQRSRFGL